jgi:hypothetical protein
MDEIKQNNEEDSMNHGIDMNPNKDIKEISVTLPNGKTQVFVEAENHNVYPKGSTQYWTGEQFSIALNKMVATGATITETTF